MAAMILIASECIVCVATGDWRFVIRQSRFAICDLRLATRNLRMARPKSLKIVRFRDGLTATLTGRHC